MKDQHDPARGGPIGLPMSRGGAHGRALGEAFSLERWQKVVVFGAAGFGAVLAAAALLWRQMDGLAVLGLVVTAGLLTLFGVAGQIPWTLWARFRQEADVQLAELVVMKQRLGADLALQILSAVVANHGGVFGPPRMVASPSPSPGGFTWTAEVYPGGDELLIEGQPSGEGELQSSQNTRVRPLVRVLYVSADTALVNALPTVVLREKGVSHRDGLLIVDANEPPRVEEVRQVLAAAGYRQLVDETAPDELPDFVRQMPVRVARPTFTELDRALFADPHPILRHVGMNEFVPSTRAARRYELSADVYTDGKRYTYRT